MFLSTNKYQATTTRYYSVITPASHIFSDPFFKRETNKPKKKEKKKIEVSKKKKKKKTLICTRIFSVGLPLPRIHMYKNAEPQNFLLFFFF